MKTGAYLAFTYFFWILISLSNSTVLRKYAGEDVMLPCGINGTSPRWYGPNLDEIPRPNTSETDISMNSNLDILIQPFYCKNKRDLCFTDLKIYESGYYKCETEIGFNSVNLIVEQQNYSTSQKEIAGDDVKINCILKRILPNWLGPDSPQIPLVYANTTTFNPNTRLVKENRLSYCENKRDLCIKDLKTYDEGVYKCQSIGIGTHTITLSVTERNISTSQTENVGDNVMLVCASNKSLPYWYGPEFTKEPLVHAGETSFNQNSTLVKENRLSYCENKRDLCIKDLKASDEGVYKCITTAQHAITLSVVEHLKASDEGVYKCITTAQHAITLSVVDDKFLKFVIPRAMLSLVIISGVFAIVLRQISSRQKSNNAAKSAKHNRNDMNTGSTGDQISQLLRLRPSSPLQTSNNAAKSVLYESETEETCLHSDANVVDDESFLWTPVNAKIIRDIIEVRTDCM